MADLNLQIVARGSNVSARRRDNNITIDIDNTTTEAATAAALAAATSVQQIGEQVEARADAALDPVTGAIALLTARVAALEDGTPLPNPDTTPDAFSFVDQTNVARSTEITSAPVTIIGINQPASWSVTGGTAQVGSGPFAGTGTVAAGETMRVRLTSSSSYNTVATATLTVGGVSDTFSVTTLAEPVVTQPPTPIGDRTVLMTTRQTLPDGAYAAAPGVGYPSTGACIDRGNNTYYGAHGTAEASVNAGFVHLSSTFSLLAQVTVNSMGLPGGSAQGIDVDGDTIWFILKATANGAYLVHCTKAGALLNAILLTNATWNGLAVDSKRNQLVMMRDDGTVVWFNKPADNATTIAASGKTGFVAAGNNNDMLHYDPLRDELLVSGGSNNTAGTVDVYDVSQTTAPTRRATLTMDQAQAIEGVVRVGDDLLIWSDQHTHPVSGQATNQVQRYVNAMVVAVSPPVYAFAAAPAALEGDAQVFTLNVTRNGTTGVLTGTYAVSGGTANAADFGGTFPTGTWTIADGATSTTITITSSEDADNEGDETYTLTASVGGSQVATVNAVIGNDDAPAGQYQAESEALFARMTTQPDTARKNAIDTMIASLKSGGVFAKADGLYVFAAHEEPSARLNWAANARNMTPGTDGASGPTFTTDRGYTTNGANNYLDYGFSPATATLFGQDNASAAIWRNDSAASATGTASLGISNSNQVGLNPRATSDVIAARINSGSATVGGASTDAKGLTAATRSSSTAVQLYKNGATSGAASSATSAAKVTGNFRSGQTNSTDRIAGNFGGAFIGAGLTSAEQTALYNAFATYMTAVGNV